MKDKSQMKVEQKLNYFDYAATSPMRQEAIDTYVQVVSQHYGNTQSLHDIGTGAADVVSACQTFWGEHFGDPEGIFFTANASEGNQLAIRSRVKGRKGTILCNPLEHASILSVMGELMHEGFEVKWIPLDERGVVSLHALTQLLSEEVLLVVVQWVNSETGIVQPVEEVLDLCHAHAIPVHCDIVQGFGKLPLPAWLNKTASSVVSGHKIGGPKGCGMTWMNPRYHWLPFYEGTTHQRGFRAGTLDVPAIAAMTVAAQLALKEQPDLFLKATLWERLIRDQLPEEVEVVGKDAVRSPFILGLLGWGRDGQHIMLEGNRAQFAFSTQGVPVKLDTGKRCRHFIVLGIPRTKLASLFESHLDVTRRMRVFKDWLTG